MTWKKVANWPAYEVSDRGEVRSYWERAGQKWSIGQAPRLMVPGKSGTGYLTVTLSHAGRRRTRYVHDLVAEAFLGPRPVGQYVCHRNSIPTDNRASNLRYDSASGNAADAARLGPHPSLSRQQVELMRLRYQNQHSYADIAREFHTTPEKVRRAMLGLHKAYKFGHPSTSRDPRIPAGDVRKIRKMYHGRRYTLQEIADQFGISPSSVCRIGKRQRRADVS